MRVHNLKILNDFADAVVMGEKPFEIRKNDRGYQKGDYIKFQAIDESGTPNGIDITTKQRVKNTIILFFRSSGQSKTWPLYNIVYVNTRHIGKEPNLRPG